MFLVVAGAALTVFAGQHFAYAAGFAGTTGRLRIETCVSERVGGHRYPHCGGVFRSSDGAVVNPDAFIDAHLSVGSTVTVRQTASGAYEETGLAPTCGWLAVSLLGLMVLLLGVLVIRGGRGASRRLLMLLAALGVVMLLSALIGGVAGLTGAL
ncbi:hypothetical protein [Streptomyces sp. NPDC048277]|uniref:hypothetical protein n=1 Tax=Streptomyces sp. NPDC048277 TaxID=3155027 RepID=UPI0033C88960